MPAPPVTLTATATCAGPAPLPAAPVSPARPAPSASRPDAGCHRPGPRNDAATPGPRAGAAAPAAAPTWRGGRGAPGRVASRSSNEQATTVARAAGHAQNGLLTLF